jgi:hypothetical protein
MTTRALLPRLLLLCAAIGCDAEVRERQYNIMIQVESDVGVPLANARILRDNREQGATKEDGTLQLALTGREGDSAALRVACPEDYASPDAAISVTLRSLAGTKTVPRYKALCPPLLRNLVVAVRTTHASGLPITFRGREVARTDHSGAAHVLLRVPPKEQIALTLDTSSDPQLRPKSPELTLDMPPQDKIVLFDKTFTREQPPKPKAPRQAKHLGPTPLKIIGP